MVLPKSISAKRFFFVCLFVLFHTCVFGQAGIDGAKIINATNTIVNDYTVLITNASVGNTILQVVSNSLNTGFASSLTTGDLIFIVQVQGATMNSTDAPAYGDIISYQNCGNNEFAEVASVSGPDNILLSCPLQFNYNVSGKVEIIRVPRYSALTINGGASLTCPAWNGSTGGILAVEVSGNTIINSGGSIDVSGKGFRGGTLINNNSAYGVLNYRWAISDYGAEKGESITGSVTDYDIQGGRYCKGAPANGGGGGSAHNAGGGGGANAGNILNYNGFGNPDNSNASWASAWNLESAGFAASTSSGGGKGGYTFSSGNQNALVVGPFNPAWGGDQRRENGGRGGRPLDYSTGKIFLGGGGGAGEENNSKGGGGGTGGGIFTFLSYAGINGAGQILANGTNGFSTTTTNGTDGAGGGGSGGTVLLNTSTAVSGITINANGGNGGSQSILFFTTETEGPGGGGGGGYIALSNGVVTRNATGGANGTTNSSSLTEFPPNGATKGGSGINNASLNAFRIVTQTINLCSSSSTTLTFSISGIAPSGVVYSWYDQPTGGPVLGTGNSYTTPVLSSSHTYFISACPGSVRVPLQVNISNNLSATFSSNIVCAGSPITFSASGSAGITSWSWDFGDGSGTSLQQNPVYTYSNGGTYIVTLTVSDGVCTASFTQNATANNAPIVSYTSTASGSGCGPMTVLFNNSSANASGYSWNFGDGSPVSTQTNPSHTYTASGSYTVVLTATGSGCTRSNSLVVSVGPPPIASFISNNNICQNDTVYFTNQSSGNGSAITSLNWDFGDGSPQSNLTNPHHVYSGTGTFNVILTATSALCSDDTIISITVNAAPVVNFTASAVLGCTPLNVIFTNNTTGSPTYSWNFGDGSPISVQSNPSHVYNTAGSFSVTLIAIQGSCRDTLSFPNMINTTNSPLASFSSLNAICLGDSISFTNSSNGNGSTITNYSWDFGDGSPLSTSISPSHYYSSSGSYSVRLSVYTSSCIDDTIIVVNVNPGPIASFNVLNPSACGSVVANFNNTTTGFPSYFWNFGDGSPVSNQTSPVHIYSTPGNFTVTLIATQGSCADTTQQINIIHVLNQPLSSFSTTDVCIGDSVNFANLSNGNGSPIVSYSWDYGDGNSGTGALPVHYYTSSGTYNVQLTVNTVNCSDDTTISISVNPVPVNNFTSSLTHACDSATVQFINSTSGAASYSWLFGDGSASSASSPVHLYSSPGNYTVILTATSAGGCSASLAVLNMVNIHTTPVASFTASSTNICVNQCISFNGQSTAGATLWNWTFNGATPSTAASQNPGNVCYSSIANYDVTLQVSNGFCQSSHVEVSYIHVVDCSTIPKANFISSDSLICPGTCINFVDLSSNAISWQWFFPGAIPGSSNIEHPMNICYSNQGFYNVTLIAGNTAGYDTISYSNFIQVAPPPITPSITLNGNLLTSTSAIQYQWYFNNTPVSGATAQQYSALLSGDYFVLTTDANGCTAASSSVFISFTGIEDPDQKFIFYIYPNPANDEISVMLHCRIPLNLTISLFDVLGNTIFSDHLSVISNEERLKYNVKDLAAGMYFLYLQSEDQRLIRPILKQ